MSPLANTLLGGPEMNTQNRGKRSNGNAGFNPNPQINGGGVKVIDGTPMKVVTIAFAAAAGLVALRWAGFKFHVSGGTR